MPQITDKLLASTILPFIPRSVTPNQVTIVRIILTPLVVALLWYKVYALGLVVFLVASLTDAIDGAMARTRNQITNVGKMLDPAADKLLIGSVALVLINHTLGWNFAFALIVAESLSVVRGIAAYAKGVVLQANNWGKIKMILEVMAVSILLLGILLNMPVLFDVAALMLVIAMGLALVSVLSYGA